MFELNYLLDVRARFRAALNCAPGSYWSDLGETGTWMPLRDHLRMPHHIQAKVCHARDLDLRRLNYSGACLAWQTAEIWQDARAYGDLDSMGRRKKSKEDTFFYALSPKGNVDCILRLTGDYVNRPRASERFSHDAYIAELGQAFVVDLSPKELAGLWKGREDVIATFEQFVTRELAVLEGHHRHGLGVCKEARATIEERARESSS